MPGPGGPGGPGGFGVRGGWGGPPPPRREGCCGRGCCSGCLLSVLCGVGLLLAIAATVITLI